jgi:tRNA(Ile)-lysidine synthase
MPKSTYFGLGFLCRPFLDISKQSIKDYAAYNKLSWIEDPSNGCDDFDRNYLRNNIVPQLKQRWPSLDKTVARSSRHCASSYKISQGLVKELLNRVYDKTDNTLSISDLLKLDVNKQHLLLRQWFSCFQLRMPSEKMLKIILNEGVLAQVSAKPELTGKGFRIRRYRDKLYCLTSDSDITGLDNNHWSNDQMQLKLEDGQQLLLIEADVGILKTLWQESKITIKYRKGSERIRLPGRVGHHTLKNLYQEIGIPPWERHNIPLIYLDDRLAAVADLCVSADCINTEKGGCYQISRKNNDKNDRIISF